MTYMCDSELGQKWLAAYINTNPGNGFSHIWHQAIAWTNDALDVITWTPNDEIQLHLTVEL